MMAADHTSYRRLKKRFHFLVTSYLNYFRQGPGNRSGTSRCMLGFLFGALALFVTAALAWSIVTHIKDGSELDGSRNFRDPSVRVDAWNNFLKSRDLRIVQIVADQDSSSSHPRCVDIRLKDSEPMESLSIQLYKCNNKKNQMWVLHNDNSIRSQLENMSYCLDYAMMEERLKMTKCSEDIAKWRYIKNTGEIQLLADESVLPKCLTTYKHGNHEFLKMKPCRTGSSDSSTQKFDLL
eukprot:jgi/Bigna1/127463/aug1.4_g2171